MLDLTRTLLISCALAFLSVTTSAQSVFDDGRLRPVDRKSVIPTTRPARSPVPAGQPQLKPPAKPENTYFVVQLHGAIGEDVLAPTIENGIADAVRQKATVIVLDIDSPGGAVAEAEKILEVLHAGNKRSHIVAFVGQDYSAAAIVTLSCKEIYVRGVSAIGAATAFIPSNQPGGEHILSPKLEEKHQSAWRAVARNSAEEGGHEPLLAEAMIDNGMELRLEKLNGKPVVREAEPGESHSVGDKVLCRRGKILTLSSHEAVDCGLAKGTADDYAELGNQLGMPAWTELQPTPAPVAADAHLPARGEGAQPATKPARPKSFDGVEFPPLASSPKTTPAPLHTRLDDVSKMLMRDPASIGVRVFNSEKSDKMKAARLTFKRTADSTIAMGDGRGGTATETTHGSEVLHATVPTEWFAFNIGDADLAGFNLTGGVITEIQLFYKSQEVARKALNTAANPSDWRATMTNGSAVLALISPNVAQQGNGARRTGRVAIGMTEQQVLQALGLPYRKNKTISAGGTEEQWVYSNGYIYLENGVVTTMQISE